MLQGEKMAREEKEQTWLTLNDVPPEAIKTVRQL
jgi:hypothetical protein